MKKIRAWQDGEAATFFANVLLGSRTDCWFWLGHRDRLGYGHFHFHGQKALAHRRCFEATIGPVPEGLELDHLCRAPSCVNPAHLEPVTHRENIKRGVRFWQKCPHGDKYRYASNRTCGVCANARRRELNARKREARRAPQE